MDYDFVLVDVFSPTAFAGNQLAVLPDADGLTAQQMQAIAQEFNFAETAFVLPAEDDASTHRLRIFSPGEEMAFAGHPTVGTAAVLASLDGNHDRQAQFVFAEPVGPVRAEVEIAEGRLHSSFILAATLDQPRERPNRERYAEALSLPASAIHDTWFGSVGLRFCFAEITDPIHVDDAVLAPAAWARAFAKRWASKLFFFAGNPVDRATVYARMFAPDIGIAEDPATGSACAALVARAALDDPRPDARVTLTIIQGHQMGRRSEIAATAVKEHGSLRHVTVAGDVTVVGRGTLTVPPAAKPPGVTSDPRPQPPSPLGCADCRS
jgi:trans-2,3-dihydro-3-hydroxyanthranilate isomerase